MSIPENFLIIDDDPVNNHICTKYIEIAFPQTSVVSFTLPDEGLAYIQSAFNTGRTPTILFLDINMPVLSGWDVLDRFALFRENIRNQFTIFMLSSSVALEDKQKAKENPSVTGFIEKPLSIDSLKRSLGV